MTPEEQDEARAIFEREFGTTDHLSEYVQRAHQASIAFQGAALDYVSGNATSASSTMQGYADGCHDIATAAFDLACAGVFTVAEFLRTQTASACESCKRSDCDSIVPFLGTDDDVDHPAQVAVLLVNRVVAEPATSTLRDLMVDLYRSVGAHGVYEVAVALLDVYAQVQEMVRDGIE